MNTIIFALSEINLHSFLWLPLGVVILVNLIRFLQIRQFTLALQCASPTDLLAVLVIAFLQILTSGIHNPVLDIIFYLVLVILIINFFFEDKYNISLIRKICHTKLNKEYCKFSDHLYPPIKFSFCCQRVIYWTLTFSLYIFFIVQYIILTNTEFGGVQNG